MFLRKFAVAASALLFSTVAAVADPLPWETSFQPAVTPVMERIEDFHRLLLYIIVAISLIVLALLVWIMIRYNKRANPVPSKTAHNTLIEVIWTIVPVIILVIIAIPSFKLLYYEAAIPTPDLKIKAIGKQWFWTYEYPAANFTYDSLGLSDADAAKENKPRLLGVDNPIYVPVNKVVEIETAGADVIHSWAVPAFGVKMDAVPGRLNHTWFQATKEGVYYGECSELCGARHAFMPIEVHVVSQAEYDAWLAGAKKKYAAIEPETHVAQLAK
jgi:cytochrome c oxidase subunit 2